MCSLTAQALCWCLSTCYLICQKSFGIPSVLSPHPRSKVTWWCCWKEWLSATRTLSCTGWDCVSIILLDLSPYKSVLYKFHFLICALNVFLCRIWSLQTFSSAQRVTWRSLTLVWRGSFPMKEIVCTVTKWPPGDSLSQFTLKWK